MTWEIAFLLAKAAEAKVPKACSVDELLKDPEIRARIEKPLPIPAITGPVPGAAPPPPTDANGNPVPQPMPDDSDA